MPWVFYCHIHLILKNKKMKKTNQLNLGEYLAPELEVISIYSEGVLCLSAGTEDMGNQEGSW